MKISEILHDAADKFLAHNYSSWQCGTKERFSCCAVSEAIFANFGCNYALEERILDGLEEMGCPTGSTVAVAKWGMDPNSEATSEETQGARYMWLKFAALMAEEQGV